MENIAELAPILNKENNLLKTTTILRDFYNAKNSNVNKLIKYCELRQAFNDEGRLKEAKITPFILSWP